MSDGSDPFREGEAAARARRRRSLGLALVLVLLVALVFGLSVVRLSGHAGG